VGKDEGTDLTVADERRTMPVVHRFQADLRDMPPAWLPWAQTPETIDPGTLTLPSDGILEAMEQELLRGLQGCTPKQAAAAAAALLASYPQRESDSRLYSRAVAERMQECPADLLQAVVDKLIDSELDFRPSAGRVKQAVGAVRAERWLTLQRVQSARRWRAWAEKEAARAAEVAADRAAAEARRLLGGPIVQTLAGATGYPVSGKPEPERRRPKAKEAPVKADHLAKLRQRSRRE
jgi:hypothetical protein